MKKECQIIGITNTKGGVTKTTVTQLIARELAKKYKVLMIDFDGQATLTKMMDLPEHFEKDALEEYLEKNSSLKIFDKGIVEPLDISEMEIYSEDVKSLKLLPSSGFKMNFAAEGVAGAKDLILKKYINSIKTDYDFIIIDSLPSPGTLYKNVLLASDKLIVPIETKSNSLAGVNEFVALVNEVAEDYEKTYDSIFALPTKYNKQRKDDNDSLAEIQTDLKALFETIYPINKYPFVVLPTMPERSVFSNAQAIRLFVQDYIESFDTGKKDILLLISKIVKIIKKA